MDQRTNQIQALKKLETESESYWLNLLKTYFLDSPFVLIKGIPSLEKRHELTEKEKNRVIEQIENLGKEGLQEKEKELQEAIAKNDVHNFTFIYIYNTYNIFFNIFMYF